MPGGATVGDSGLCCCAPCLSSAIISLRLLIHLGHGLLFRKMHHVPATQKKKACDSSHHDLREQMTEILGACNGTAEAWSNDTYNDSSDWCHKPGCTRASWTPAQGENVVQELRGLQWRAKRTAQRSFSLIYGRI